MTGHRVTRRSLLSPRVLAEDVDLLAAMPLMEQKLDALQVDAVRPNGTRQPILLLSGPTPQWPARYWFDGPHLFAQGESR